ncbi:NADPH-dependent F420 reductase [Aggregatilinea lenta]|uniref:NADPH-dependent F420 reductase n=1 Tax=Aggregatilinea lenta TaxID=913108 RepID=UPI000E5A9D7F|nr:NAD(P)-binding domain-containing protein [Aggregatilinea lenta]
MDIGVLGSGMVGQAISAKLVDLGHSVILGTRDVERLKMRPATERGPAFAEWHAQHPAVRLGTFAEAAAHGEILFNCTSGQGSLNALEMAGQTALNGKVLIDISNPLDFSHGMPPSLTVCNTDSLAEQIQRAYPSVKVVKTLNTVTAPVMVNPASVANGDHTMFVSGDDANAKAQVVDLLKSEFGWQDVIDLGGISAARGMEMYLPLWVSLMGAQGTPMFNVKIAR